MQKSAHTITERGDSMPENKKNSEKNKLEISVNYPTNKNPQTVDEMVNNYGTYEIQNTANTDNQYPAIAQGYNDKIIKRDCENKHK